MAWLRERPDAYSELDKVDWKGRWIGDDGASGSGTGGMDDEQGTKKDESELFDDDEDEDESESEEEEEDAGAAGAATGTVQQQASSIVNEESNGQARLSDLLRSVPSDEHSLAFLPTSGSKRRRLDHNIEAEPSSTICSNPARTRSRHASDGEEIRTHRSRTDSNATQDTFTELETPDESCGVAKIEEPLTKTRMFVAVPGRQQGLGKKNATGKTAAIPVPGLVTNEMVEEARSAGALIVA